jgi:hypothetical protein
MAMTNPYASLVQVKAALRITDSVDDALLEMATESASRQIDSHCERVFYSSSDTRVFSPLDSYVCQIDDLATLTTLKTSSMGDGVFDITWSNSTDYQLEPLNGVAGGIDTPYTQIRAVGDYLFPTYREEATVQVTGTFGFSAIPIAITQATVILASRLYKRLDSPLGVLGFGDLGVVRVSKLDPDIASLVEPYRKMKFA